MKKLLLIATLLFSGLANALVVAPTLPLVDNVYYVSTSAKGGSDSNPCSRTRPCLTVAGAAAKVTKAGSIIHVNTSQGVFTETSTIMQSTGVTIECDGKTSNAIRAGTSGMLLINARSVNEGTDGNQELRYCKLDGNSLLGYTAVQVTGRSNYKAHDLTIVDFRDDGIYFQGLGTSATASIAPLKFATGNEIYNSTITNSSSFQGGFGHGLIWMGGQDGLLIYDNVLNQSGRTAGTNGYVIKFANNGFNKNFKIYNNDIYHDDDTYFNFAIELWHVLGCGEIFNNTIVGGMDLDQLEKGECGYSIYAHHNILGPTSLNATPGDLSFDLESGGEGLIIAYNTFRNLNHAAIDVYDNNVPQVFEDYQIFNNLCINCEALVKFSGASKNTIYSNWKIINNSILANAGGFDGLNLPCGKSTSIQVRNNIISGYTRAPIFTFNCSTGNKDELLFDSISIENNIFYNNGNSNLPWWNGVNTPTNLTYQNNLIGVNPLFVSSTDLHLQAGSPAIGAGINTGVGKDFNSFQRYGVTINPSIGAYERNCCSIP